jgi:NitT/TauT family transport system ATP-binding protein
MMPAIKLVNVGKDFGGTARTPKRVAVRHVSFSVNPGEVLCIVGKSGCGKSTLVNMMLGLERPNRGSITIDSKANRAGQLPYHRPVAAVFQTDRLLPWRTVIDNAALGLEAAGLPKALRHEAAMPWLKRVGLESWGAHYPHELSGGMRQRVSICRAFVLNPEVLILDEAFGHLDEVTAQQLRQDCLKIVAETNTAVILVTHNISEALVTGHRVLVLGKPAEIIKEFELNGPGVGVGKSHSGLREEIFELIEKQSEYTA